MSAVRFMLLAAAIVTLLVACWLTGCGGQEAPAPTAEASTTTTSSASASTPTNTPKAKKPLPAPVDPVVVLHTSAGEIRLQLFAEKAPITVNAFLQDYVRRDFYSGTIFHHADPSMIIAGGYTPTLEPKPPRTSLVLNEANNGLSNKRGMVAMIRDPAFKNSAGSQFFINVTDNPALDYQSDESDETFGYCVFGQVIAGMDVVDRIAKSPAEPQGEFASLPSESVVIESATQLR